MNLPQWPMGTVMAATMVIVALAVVVLAPDRTRRGTARLLQVLIGSLAALAALWQIAWYALRHFGSFWGAMSTASGLALFAAALLLLPREADPRLRVARWPIALALLCIGGFYAWTISRW